MVTNVSAVGEDNMFNGANLKRVGCESESNTAEVNTAVAFALEKLVRSVTFSLQNGRSSGLKGLGG